MAPSLNLSVPQRERLCTALLDAFDRSTLAQLLRFRFEERLENVATPTAATRSVVFEVIDWARMRGRTRELLVAAHEWNPSNAALTAVYQELLGGEPTPAAPIPPHAPAVQRKVVPPLFAFQDVLKIHEWLVQAGLATEETLAALAGGINLSFRSSLPSTGAPRVRLLNTLHILNATGELAGGEVPFETFLANAAYLTRSLPLSADLDRFAKSIRQR